MPFAWAHLFPILQVILVTIDCVTAFSMAFLKGHITTTFPHIMDAAAHPPQSCIVAQLVFISTIVQLCNIYIRFLQIKLIYNVNKLAKKIRNINIACLICGIIGLIGINIAINFPATRMKVTHQVGTAIGYGFEGIYYHLNTVLSFHTEKELHYPFWMKWLRIILSYLILIQYVSYNVFKITSLIQLNASVFSRAQFDWSSEDPGWIFHCVAVVSEWIYLGCCLTYVLTFIDEYSCIVLYSPIVILEKSTAETQ